MKDDPINRSIISRLFDLITDEMFFRATRPNDNEEIEKQTDGAMMIPVNTDANKVRGILSDNAGDNKEEEDNQGFEISSSATITWCCSIALHLLQLSLNVGNETRRNDTALNLKKLKSDD